MSSPETKNSLLWRGCRIAADCTQLLFVGLLLELLMFTGTGVDARARVAVIALLLIGVARSQGWIVLLGIQASYLFSESSSGALDFGLSGYLVCLASICVVAYAYSARTIGYQLSCKFANAVVAALSGLQGERTDRDLATTPRLHRSRLLARCVAMNVVVMLSFCVLNWLPVTPLASRGWLDSSLVNDKILWPGPAIFCVALLMLILIRELSWRQMTPVQARLWLRSGIMRQHHYDLMMVVRRQFKLRNRKAPDLKAAIENKTK